MSLGNSQTFIVLSDAFSTLCKAKYLFVSQSRTSYLLFKVVFSQVFFSRVLTTGLHIAVYFKYTKRFIIFYYSKAAYRCIHFVEKRFLISSKIQQYRSLKNVSIILAIFKNTDFMSLRRILS